MNYCAYCYEEMKPYKGYSACNTSDCRGNKKAVDKLIKFNKR